MTKDEYIEICKKYPEYLNMTGSGDCYIKGEVTMGLFQVTTVNYENGFVDSDKIIGKIWYKCYSPDKKTIQTKPDGCHYAYTKDDFEKYVQIFIENYKKCLVELKKQKIEKDFSK